MSSQRNGSSVAKDDNQEPKQMLESQPYKTKTIATPARSNTQPTVVPVEVVPTVATETPKDPPPESEGNEVSSQQPAAEPPAGEPKGDSTEPAGQVDLSRKAIDCRSCLQLLWSLKSTADGFEHIYIDIFIIEVGV